MVDQGRAVTRLARDRHDQATSAPHPARSTPPAVSTLARLGTLGSDGVGVRMLTIAALQRACGNQAVQRLFSNSNSNSNSNSKSKSKSKSNSNSSSNSKSASNAAQPAIRPPVIQRKIVISPEAYARGLGVEAAALTAEQLTEYVKIAVRDDAEYAEKLARKFGKKDKLGELRKAFAAYRGATTPQDKLAPLRALIKLVNEYLESEEGNTVPVEPGSEDLIPAPNRDTRYATRPGDPKNLNDPRNEYTHTALADEEAAWGSDPVMWASFSAAIGEGVFEGTYTQAKARGKQGQLPLTQIPWDEAKVILPRPLINLIFDVRYQLETEGATVIDERTPAEQAKREKSPGSGGSLRSWHTDSPWVLPATPFGTTSEPEKKKKQKPKKGEQAQEPEAPDYARKLHEHYMKTSQTGAGSTQDKSSKATGPVGYAEYTGTGSNWEHNTKVVLDYIGKRVYLTLTHYQYWALIKKGNTYEFWRSDTQERDVAAGKLQREHPNEETVFMSPWMEILMPSGGGSGSSRKTSTQQQELSKERHQQQPVPVASATDTAPEETAPATAEKADVPYVRIIGDCLYDAVNEAQGNRGANAEAFRNIATSWFLQNRELYPDLVAVANVDEVVRVLSTPGAWSGDAGDLSPLVLASALGITLEIVTPAVVHTYAPLGGDSQATVRVFHHANHYTAEPTDRHLDWEKAARVDHRVRRAKAPVAASTQRVRLSLKEIEAQFGLPQPSLQVGQTYPSQADGTHYRYIGETESVFTLKKHTFEPAPAPVVDAVEPAKLPFEQTPGGAPPTKRELPPEVSAALGMSQTDPRLAKFLDQGVPFEVLEYLLGISEDLAHRALTKLAPGENLEAAPENPRTQLDVLFGLRARYLDAVATNQRNLNTAAPAKAPTVAPGNKKSGNKPLKSAKGKATSPATPSAPQPGTFKCCGLTIEVYGINNYIGIQGQVTKPQYSESLSIGEFEQVARLIAQGELNPSKASTALGELQKAHKGDWAQVLQDFLAAFLAEPYRVEAALLANFVALGSQGGKEKVVGRSGRLPMSVGGSFKDNQLPDEFRVAVNSWIACEVLHFMLSNAEVAAALYSKPEKFMVWLKKQTADKIVTQFLSLPSIQKFLEGWQVERR